MLVLTDLTRFRGSDNVCMALLDEEDCACYRPLPYSNRSFVEMKGIMPGMIVDAKMLPDTEVSLPHTEDCKFEDEIWLDTLDEDKFIDILDKSAVDSVSDAFGGRITPKNRCVPVDDPCEKSIMTVRVDPLSMALSVVEAGDEVKLRLGFTDFSGIRYRHTPIADLHFHSTAMTYIEQGRIDELNALLAGGEQIFIRVGLSRLYESKNGKSGFWMQANGIYSFPGCFLI